jgi:hypothetical protein
VPIPSGHPERIFRGVCMRMHPFRAKHSANG